MDNPNNTSPNPKILTAASWLMIVVGILVMIHGGMNVAYCADADRLRTIAGMLIPAVLLIIGGILVERSKRYREASDKATAMFALAIISGMLLKVQTAPNGLQANTTLYFIWDTLGFIALILVTIAWAGLRIITIRYEKNHPDDEDDDNDEFDEFDEYDDE